MTYTKKRGLSIVCFKSKKLKSGDKTFGTIERTVEDDTQPRKSSGPVERRIVYEVPFTKCGSGGAL